MCVRALLLPVLVSRPFSIIEGAYAFRFLIGLRRSNDFHRFFQREHRDSLATHRF